MNPDQNSISRRTLVSRLGAGITLGDLLKGKESRE